MTIDINYFPSIRPIHELYEKKKIGLAKRDSQLKPYRDELYQTINDPHAHPTRIIKSKSAPKPSHNELTQLTADWYGVPVEDVE